MSQTEFIKMSQSPDQSPDQFMPKFPEMKRTKTMTSKVISPVFRHREPRPSENSPCPNDANSDNLSSPAPSSPSSDQNNKNDSSKLGKQLYSNIRFGEHSIQGHRGTQEDSVAIHKDVGKDLGLEENRFAFFGVFDGHGGDQASEFVSDKLPKYTSESMLSQDGKDLKAALHEAFARVEKEYCQISYESDAKDGTTAVVFLIEGNRFVAGNIGDSELVFGRAGKAVAPFQVHNPKRNKQEEERVRKEGGLIAHGRVGHPNLNPEFFSIAVSRALGDIFFKHPEFTGNKPSGLNAEPDLAEGEVLPHLDFALLACDGVWDVLNHQEAIDFVYQQLKEHNDPGKAAEALVNKAFEDGSQDNITALIVTFKDLTK